MLTKVPRWSGLRLLMSRRICGVCGGRLTAATELMVRATDRVPFWFWKTVGSTRTCTTAGVIPEEGEMVTPWVLVESWKSVFPPPGSVMATVWVITLRLQKVPRATTSRTLAARRCCWFNLPTGKTMAPLSEALYSTSPAALRMLRPLMFSGIEKLSLTSRFSASRMDRTGGAVCTAGEEGEEPVDVVEEAVRI